MSLTPESTQRIENLYKIDRLAIKVLVTFCLFLSWICLGYHGELFGPFMSTFMNQLNTTYTGYGKGLSTRSIGYLIGSIVGGIIGDMFEDYLFLFVTLSLILAGGSTAILPFCSNIYQFYLVIFFSGVSHGTLSTAGNPLISHIWLDKASGPFNLMHAGYGLGGLITSFVIKIFNEAKEHDQLLRPVPSFITSTVANFVIAIVFIGFFIRHRFLKTRDLYAKKRKENFVAKELKRVSLPKENILHMLKRESKVWLAKTKLHNPYLIILITVIYFCLIGNERVASKFLYTYTEKGVNGTTTDDAIYIHGTFWLLFSIGRLVVAVLSLKIPIIYLFIAQITGTVVFSLMMWILPKEKIYLYVFILLFSGFKSPLFPTMLGVFGRICYITGLVILFIDVGSSSGAISYQYFSALIIQSYGITSFPIILFGTSVIIFFLSLLLVFYVRKHRKDFKFTIAAEELT